MTFLVELWLPMLASAVAVFAVSSVVHMVLQHHKRDSVGVPNEAAVLSALRQAGLTRGDYMFPYAGSMKAMATPEMQAKLAQGPVGYLTVLPNGPFSMGKSLTLWFLYSLAISFLSGYVGWHAMGAGAGFSEVLRIAGSVALGIYATALVHGSIWRGIPWAVTVRFGLDGVAYGVTTGLVFAWLWPA